MLNVNTRKYEMRNKLFELYRPKQLAEFLEFNKANPDESFVYVLQHPPRNINILTASDYGYLVICLPENSQMLFSPAPVSYTHLTLPTSDLV